MARKTLNKLLELQSVGLIGNLHKSINFTDEPRFFQYFSVDSSSNKSDSNGVGFSDNKDSAKIKAMEKIL